MRISTQNKGRERDIVHENFHTKQRERETDRQRERALIDIPPKACPLGVIPLDPAESRNT